MSEVNVTIFDRSYRLAVTSGEEAMLEECAREVNEQMLAVRAAGRVIAIDQIAVLTALELAYDAKKRQMEEASAPQKAAAPEPAAAEPAPPPPPPAPVQEEDPELLAEVRDLCRLCEDALFRDVRIGTLF